jgi:hypothetical protein
MAFKARQKDLGQENGRKHSYLLALDFLAGSGALAVISSNSHTLNWEIGVLPEPAANCGIAKLPPNDPRRTSRVN